MTNKPSIVARALLILGAALSLSACATGGASFNALVVHQEYDGTIPGLPAIDTKTDAEAVSAALQGMKRATVQQLPTVSQAGWTDALETYLQQFPKERGEDAVVYIAAHGLRGNDGRTYLFDAHGTPIALEPLLEQIMQVSRASMIFVDVCRSPEEWVTQRSKELAERLAALHAKNTAAPTATLAGLKGNQAVILFSTDAGNTAADGSGRGSRFAQVFIREFPKRQELRVTLRNIVSEFVDKKKNNGADGVPVDHNEQNPWPYGLITRDIFPAGRPSSGGAT